MRLDYGARLTEFGFTELGFNIGLDMARGFDFSLSLFVVIASVGLRWGPEEDE